MVPGNVKKPIDRNAVFQIIHAKVGPFGCANLNYVYVHLEECRGKNNIKTDIIIYPDHFLNRTGWRPVVAVLLL